MAKSLESPVSVAVLRYCPMASTKVNRVGKLVRGMTVRNALSVLRVQPHRAARVLEGLVGSAAGNAVAAGCRDADSLVVSKLVINGGPMRKTIRAKSRGMAYVERARSTHVWCELAEKRSGNGH